jgi:hypothetical protein
VLALPDKPSIAVLPFQNTSGDPALGGLALAGAGYFALGMCTLALPLASAILVWFRRPDAAEGAR